MATTYLISAGFWGKLSNLNTMVFPWKFCFCWRIIRHSSYRRLWKGTMKSMYGLFLFYFVHALIMKASSKTWQTKIGLSSVQFNIHSCTKFLSCLSSRNSKQCTIFFFLLQVGWTEKSDYLNVTYWVWMAGRGFELEFAPWYFNPLIPSTLLFILFQQPWRGSFQFI